MPLTFRSINSSGSRFDVVSGKVVVGSLWKPAASMVVGQDARWHWTLNALSGPNKHGSALNFEQAKAAIERDWQAWFTAAGLHE